MRASPISDNYSTREVSEGFNGHRAPTIYLHSIRQEQHWPEFWLLHLCGRNYSAPSLPSIIKSY